jgi:predicted metal-dependent hydrolase
VIAFTTGVQFQLNPGAEENNGCSLTSLLVGQHEVTVALVRNPRARRYVLRLRRDGIARVTIPRGGSIAEAKAFAKRNAAWLERQWYRLAAQPPQHAPWHIGSEILFRGESVLIEARLDHGPATICVGSECLQVSATAIDLRPAVENHLRRVAKRELPPRVFELAALHQLDIRRVSVRNQKSRWGSCSRRGTISLNWRLVQTPAFVRDYIILHELMHLRQMNHSSRFWREVERVCPEYKTAEAWLKRHSELLRQ